MPSPGTVCGESRELPCTWLLTITVLTAHFKSDHRVMITSGFSIRVKGGAYGCMNGYMTAMVTAYLVSYRDPNLEKTNEIL